MPFRRRLPTHRLISRPSPALALAAVAVVALAGCGSSSSSGQSASGPVKVGVLYSLSGDLAITERPMYEATMLAIEEVNAAGGIKGRQIQPVVEDYASNFQVVAEKATKLTTQDKVVATVGLYTSASRKASLPVFEKNKGLLIYPTQYEGLECSPNVIYTGVVPSQQLKDFVPWVLNNLGKKVFLVGSDYIYPRTTNAIVTKLIQEGGGKVVGERYFPLGQTEFGAPVSEIARSGADVVLSTVVGNSVPAFYVQFRASGLDPATLPIVSPVTTEQENAAMGGRVAEGTYATSPYFQSVDTPENKKFVAAMKAKYGAQTVISREQEAAYDSVFLLKAAAEAAPDLSLEALQKAFVGASYDAPQGTVKIDKNHHMEAKSLIGRANADGQFEIVKDFKNVLPEPFPTDLVEKSRIPTCPTPAF